MEEKELGNQAPEAGTDKTVENEVDNSELNTAVAQKKHWREKAEGLEAELASLKAQAPKEEPKAKKADTNSELGFAEKAYLMANGVKGSEEMGFVKTFMEETGKNLDQALESKYFKAELKEFRENKAAREATPTTSKRSTTNSRDKAEYWIAKGELPPADQPKLRAEVVNAKIVKASTEKMFTDNPIG